MTETTTRPRQGMASQDDQSRQGMAKREASQHSEGIVARTLEQQTAKLPSDLW